MKNNPVVSILINNYNYKRFLGEAIDSALGQTYAPIEIIVVDDGSTDNSQELIASYGDKIIPVFKPNGGQASAFNAGFAASQGEIICFLDADDLFLPRKIEVIVEALGNSEELGWCFHYLQRMDSDTNTSNSQASENSSFPLEVRECDFRASMRQGKHEDKGHKDKMPPSTSSLCFRRSLLEQILPMPEGKGISLNDGYLEFTAFGLSKGLFLDRELGLYRIHGTNAFAKTKDRQQKVRVILATGYWMRINFPILSKYANKLIAAGLGMGVRRGGMEPEYQELIKRHLASVTLWEKLGIYLKAANVYLKNPKD